MNRVNMVSDVTGGTEETKMSKMKRDEFSVQEEPWKGLLRSDMTREGRDLRSS